MPQVSENSKCVLEEREKERQRLEQYRDELMQLHPIDRSYTSFGGNGTLTEEQYEEGMQLFKKMRNCRYW